ncbi:DUF4595 domain-containing protein [Dysgonomonas sp. BGC7]|uniref:DUF4595 domain-containing protein n=1 Tax=Dysgonomonas sp. BGC7 TaxID=1658008 RepID=UPI00067FF594|nr:DUF4595 domain-containing protein [Dysgonomonas sp. BGC7]MBD8388995.1 DUF4595 domain-containing protein [Dysgonomonas sp. BGC7]
MKTTKLLFLLTLIFTGLTFSSCSSDDDNEGGGSSVNFGPKNVFTGDLPKTIGLSTIKYNSDGLLEEVLSTTEKVTFEYPSQTKSTGNTVAVIMKVNDLQYPEDSYTVKFAIGSNGFASRALQTYADNSTDTWEFSYNRDGQLNYMKRSEGDNEVTNITYADGNITGIKMESDDKSEGVYTTSIGYTSDAHPNGIENKGCVMLFDITFGADLDEMEVAYYAGLLGRATKKLPLKKTEQYVGETTSDTYIFDWTLNTKGYPTKVSYMDGEYDESLNLGW